MRELNKQINKSNKPDWGKMNVFQMLIHNTYWNRWILGKESHTYKQAFLGKVFGKIALKKMIKDEKPFDKNIPTSDQFKVKETTADLESEKSEWISLVKEYENYNNPNFAHDFFGKMTKEEIGIFSLQTYRPPFKTIWNILIKPVANTYNNKHCFYMRRPRA